jgi:hypothetical protein
MKDRSRSLNLHSEARERVAITEIDRCGALHSGWAGDELMNDSMEIQEAWNWQDWLDMVLGLWLAVSPWVLDFVDSDPAGTRNVVIVGIAIAVLSALTFLAYHIVEEWLDVLLGVWLIVSPWVLPGSGDLDMVANFVIVGAIVLTLSGYEILAARHGHPHPE